MRESPSSEVSLHGGLVKAADPHRDPHAERADGSSGNRDVEEYFNSSENDQKRPENDIFRIFLLFVISRSGVRVRLPAPILSANSELNMGEFPSGQRGQTVNLLSVTSVVRIHLPPPKSALKSADFCFIRTF